MGPIEDGYCTIVQPGERIPSSGPNLGTGLTELGSTVVRKTLRMHAVKVTEGAVPGGQYKDTVSAVCGRSFVRDGLNQQNAWKDQLLAPLGDRYLNDAAPPCDDCKAALDSLEWEDVRRAPE
ncbi:MAG: hypothetical protein ABSG36_18735 [Acidimicrobiales bacterium]